MEYTSGQRRSFKEITKIFNFVWPYKITFLWGLLFLILSSITVLIFPYLTGKMVDAATGEANWWLDDINKIALGLIGIIVLQSIFSYLRVYLFAIVSQKTMANVRQTLYNKIITLPTTFFESRRTGELISRITADVEQIQSVVSTGLAEFFRQIATLIVGICIIFYTSPKLTLMMLSVVPVLVIAAIVFGKYIKKLAKKTQDEVALSNVIVEEAIQSIQIIKSFTNELFEIFKYKQAQNQIVSIALRTAKYRAAFIAFIIFGLFSAIVLVLWYGAQLILANEITIGDLTSFLIYTTFIGGSIGGLGDVYAQIQKAIGASERIKEILNEEEELDLTEQIDPVELTGKITFNKVQFYYPTRTDVTVLNNVSFEIESGQRIAFVGPSGAGKSTIVQLIMRFYNPNMGEIKIDDTNICNYNIQALRKNIAIVPQETILFGGTIKENILYGNTNAGDEAVKDAADKAYVTEFVERFPDGFDTMIGEKGIKLSGGQRQRIAIARAILKNPAILILDEATSSLDAASEKLVQQALDNLMTGRTSIIIAHRLSTIRKADHIYVLKNGKIVEKGNHEELIEKENGLYNELSKLQLN